MPQSSAIPQNTRAQYPLSSKKILKKTLASTWGILVALILFMIISLFISAMSRDFAPIFFGALTLFPVIFVVVYVLLAYLYQSWYFKTYFYDLGENYVMIKKGPLTPREITIPYERIQDIYVDQDLLDRMFGLYDVHISSATISSGMSAHIDGVEKTVADGLRQLILEKVSQKLHRPVPSQASNSKTAATSV